MNTKKILTIIIIIFTSNSFATDIFLTFHKTADKCEKIPCDIFMNRISEKAKEDFKNFKIQESVKEINKDDNLLKKFTIPDNCEIVFYAEVKQNATLTLPDKINSSNLFILKITNGQTMEFTNKLNKTYPNFINNNNYNIKLFRHNDKHWEDKNKNLWIQADEIITQCQQ